MSTKQPNPRGANAIDRHVGNRVLLRRKLLGMSQEKLGEKLGITFQQIQKYERGTNRIGAGRLFALAGVLAVPVSFFYEGLDPVHSQQGRGEIGAVEDLILSADSISLSKAFASISDVKVRRRILALVKTLAAEQAEVAALDQAS